MVALAIVDYKAGNLTSVENAVRFLGYQGVVTQDPQVIANAERVIFPGVGAAGSSMQTLHESGLGQAVQQVVASGRPVLGICIGSQIILERSEEDGGVDCLGLVQGYAKRFDGEPHLSIPHMGWNQVQLQRKHPLFAGVPEQSEFYFVHSFYPVLRQSHQVAAQTTYGSQTFCSAIDAGNLFATQFHLEKSGDVGLQVIQNFCTWDGQSC